MDLQNRACIVTGGASGIGLAVVRAFVANGARVAIADVNADNLRAAAAETGALPIACDVSDRAAVEAMVTQVADQFGGIDVLVNNAGFGMTGTVVTTPEDAWDRIMAVNLKSMFLCSRSVIPVMARRKRGVIINTTSYTAVSAIGNRAAYVASKGAISALTRAMAIDHAAEGIRVNAVAPGTIDSPYFSKIFAQADDPDALRAAFGDRAVMGRMGKADEIAQAFLFLAADRSAFATGSVLTVDGGSSIGNHLVE